MAMTHKTLLNRRWTRSSGRHRCCILPHQRTNAFANAAIVNLCQGGLLIETDVKFIHGDRLTILNRGEIDINGLCIEHDVHGTVLWGLNAESSSMGRYRYGVEFDEVLPLKLGGDKRGETRSDSTPGTDVAPGTTEHTDLIEHRLEAKTW
jgi:hypothetical protein